MLCKLRYASYVMLHYVGSVTHTLLLLRHTHTLLQDVSQLSTHGHLDSRIVSKFSNTVVWKSKLFLCIYMYINDYEHVVLINEHYSTIVIFCGPFYFLQNW